MNDIGVEELQSLYQWVDTIPLSRPKRNIGRDFSDGVLCAELVHHYLPKLVDLHNYSSASGISQKIYNWDTLNTKCFKRIGLQATRQDFEAVSNCVPGAVEKLLQQLQVKIAKYHSKQQNSSSAIKGSRVHSHRSNSSHSGNHGHGHGSRHEPSRKVDSSRKTHHSHSLVSHSQQEGRSGSSSPNVRELHSKDRYIQELKEANEILDTKVRKLEQLVRLKDAKIQTLQAKLQAVGLESATRIYS